MIKKNWIYLLFALAALLFTFTHFKSLPINETDQVNVSLKTFHTGIGWGYDIYTNDSLYIHQEYMPAIDGRKGFETEEEANKIGKLVMTKLKYNKFPMISLKELDSCGIKNIAGK